MDVLQLTPLALCLCAATATAEIRAAAMSFSTRGVPAELGGVYAERFATALRKQGITVTTEKDLASVLSVERQRQLLGCADSSNSCLAELAGALGAPFIITGSVARIGSAVTLSLKVLEVEKSRPVYSLSSELPSPEKVLDALESAAPDAAERLREASGGATGSAAPVLVGVPQASPSVTPAWVVIALGAAGVGVGTGLLLAAQQVAQVLYGAPMQGLGPDAALQLATQTAPLRTAGWVTLGIGGAAFAAGVIWRVVQGSSTSVALVPTSGGAALAVGGAW